MLTVDFHRDPAELNAANPKLVAESMQDWEGFALEVQGSFAIGILLVVVGGVLLTPFRIPKLDEAPHESPQGP